MKLDDEQSELVIGLIKDKIKGQHELEESGSASKGCQKLQKTDETKKKIKESNAGEKNGHATTNKEGTSQVTTPGKQNQKDKADSTTKESCFEPHYEPRKHPSCPYRKPPIGVGYKAAQTMKVKHPRIFKKRKLFNDSNDSSVEDNAGTETSMDVESEGNQSKSTPKKKVFDGNAHRHPESEGKLPKSTPTKKVCDGNAEEEIGDLGKPSKNK